MSEATLPSPHQAVITLSESPRAPKLIPQLASLTGRHCQFDFKPLPGHVVGLHIHDSWQRAKNAAAAGVALELAREDNEHDPNAVACYLSAEDEPKKMVGFLSRGTAAVVAPLLDDGMPLCARPTGSPPRAGRGSRGGCLDIQIVAVDD